MKPNRLFAITLFLITSFLLTTSRIHALSCCPSGYVYYEPPACGAAGGCIEQVGGVDYCRPAVWQCPSNWNCINGICYNLLLGTPTPGPTGSETCDDPGEICCSNPDLGRFCLNGLTCIRTGGVTTPVYACQWPPAPSPLPAPEYSKDICLQVGPTGSDIYFKCSNCIDSRNGVWTGLGCFNTTPEGFIENLLQVGLGLAGGFALLLMLYGAFLIASSAGNPEQTQKGQQVFGSAVAGLLFIIFSLVILRTVGVDILGIPGF